MGASTRLKLKLLIFFSQIINILTTEYYTYEVSNCSTNSNTSQLPNCSIISTEQLKTVCVGPSAIKVWYKGKVDGELQITCDSSKQMSVAANFQDGNHFPRLKESYVHVERFASDIDDKNTYKYKVRLHPQLPYAVRYLISHTEDVAGIDGQGRPGVSVMVFFDDSELGICWMAPHNGSAAIFEATQELVTIPCIQEGEHFKDLLYIVNNPGPNENLTKLSVDNSSLTYEPSSGFIFNTTAFSGYADHLYRCLPDEYEGREFRIVDLPELKVTPLMPSNGSDIKLYASKAYNNAPVKLECNYKAPIRLEGKVMTNIVGDRLWLVNFYRNDGPLQTWKLTTFNISNVQYEYKRLPSVRYSAILERHLYVFDQLTVNCVKESDGKILYSWNVSVYDTGLTDTGLKYLKFNYPTRKVISNVPRVNVYEYQCYSNVYQDVQLRSISCSNMYQCLLLEDCFEPGRKCAQVVNEGSRCPPSEFQPFASCQQTRAVLPGEVTVCRAGGQEFKQYHFVGFDDMIYNFYEFNFPATAVLRIEYVQPAVPEVFYTNISYEFTCRVHQFFSEGRLYVNHTFIQETKIYEGIQNQNVTSTTPYSATTLIKFDASGVHTMECKAPVLFSKDSWITSKAAKLNVQDSTIPEILSDETNRKFEAGLEDQIIVCEASGRPMPSLEWTGLGKNMTWNEVNGTAVLNLGKISKEVEGLYTCVASNGAGTVSKKFAVSIKKDIKLIISILSITAGAFVMLITLSMLIYRYRQAMKPRVRMNETELDEFYNGRKGEISDDSESESPNPDAPDPGMETIDVTTASELPFIKTFEIKKEEIKLIDKKRLLGEGAYGIVHPGILVKNRTEIHVAVKMTKKDCPDDIYKALQKELKLMTRLGGHANLISLIGAYIAEIRIGILYVFTELCENGSLKDYMKNNKSYYGDTRATKQIGSRYTSKYLFGFPDLVRWSAEIASGMKFLAKLKILHLDLAARNILLNKELTAKISDFGLSRNLYEKIHYVKVGTEPLPWQWLAVECFFSSTFSTESDVWAYGILLWEIFSLGDEPYPGIEFTPLFGNQLLLGLHNLSPTYATDDIYEVMLKCWHQSPEARPTFPELIEFFTGLQREGSAA